MALRLLAYLFLASWLIQLPALYPLPGDRVASFENPAVTVPKAAPPEAPKSANQLDVKPVLESELWRSWVINVVIILAGLLSSVLILMRSRMWPLALVLSSLLFVGVWWWFSGVGEQSVTDWIHSRWIVWPKLTLQLQGLKPFAKIISNDYVLFTFYHACAVIGLVALAATKRATGELSALGA